VRCGGVWWVVDGGEVGGGEVGGVAGGVMVQCGMWVGGRVAWGAGGGCTCTKGTASATELCHRATEHIRARQSSTGTDVTVGFLWWSDAALMCSVGNTAIFCGALKCSEML
jgi:hypothetical protein